MVWGAPSVTPAVLSALAEDRRSGRARYLLGFNEPDSQSQSDISPAQAAALWPSLEQTGLRLGSPAPSNATDGWLAQFMAIARAQHLRVDFIALHYYQDFTDPDAIAALRRQLVALHRQYGKPIWITEIGAIDLRTWGEPMLRTPTAALAQAYERQVFALLNALPFVQRYAWFTDDCWKQPACRFSSLFDANGRPTAAGEIFARDG
jgi:Glycosyl hydrolase catalytic core